MSRIIDIRRNRFCAICEYWSGENVVELYPPTEGRYKIVDVSAKGRCLAASGRPERKADFACSKFQLRSHLY